jgi:beta-lactamase regulating signal transducer with metallopeptidase domain/DUF4097 and DUF4098 domain-containing protein YvlB
MIPDPLIYGPVFYQSMIFPHITITQIISALPQAALRSLALAIGVWVILRLFRVRNVLALKCAWTLVLATAFLMPLLLPMASRLPRATLVLPAFMHRAAPATSAFSSEQAVPSQPSVPPAPHQFAAPAASRPRHTATPVAVPTELSVLPVPEAPSPQAPALPTFPIFAAIAFLYFAISGLFLVRFVYGLVRAYLLWRSACPVATDLSVTHGLRLRASAAVSSPVTIGSSIILPADFRSWDGEKLRIVLAHERSHVRQGDFYLQALAGLYAAIVWFSPLGWWLKHQLSDLAEALSDRSGLEEAASRASYAQILLEFAAAPHLTEIGVAMARSSNLSHRIERLFNESAFRQAFTASRRTLATALLVPVTLFAAATFVRVTAAAQTPEQTPSAQSPTPPAAPSTPAAAPAPPQAPAPGSNAAPATPATPAQPARVDVPPIHVNVPAVHVNVAAQHINVPAVHVDVPAKHFAIPAQHIDVPAVHVIVPAVHVGTPSRQIDIAAKHIDIPAKQFDIAARHIDIPARQIDIPSRQIDIPARHIDIPAIHIDMPQIDVPPSDAPSGSDGRASNGYGGELLAMLDNFGHSLFIHASVADQAETTFDRNLTFNGKLDLSVATGAGSITITRGAGNQIHIHGIVKVNRNGDPAQAQQIAANPPIEQEGNTIRIGGHQENLHNISISYEIEAPADAALNAATGSGNITDTGVGQDAQLHTGSGDITATGIDGGFKAQTGSGNIAIDGSGQGDAKAQTGSGTIDLKGVHGSLTARTGSGTIKAAGTPSSPWKLETGSGSIELATGNAPMNLDASTGSGKISTGSRFSSGYILDPTMAPGSENHHHLRAQLNGGGPEVRVETGSGSIRVD